MDTLAQTGQSCINSPDLREQPEKVLAKSVTKCNFKTTKRRKIKKKKTTFPRRHNTVMSTKLTATVVGMFHVGILNL